MRTHRNSNTEILEQKLSSVVPGRPLGLKEQKVPSGVGVRYLYQPGELEGGRRRATGLVWSLEVYGAGTLDDQARRASVVLPAG